MKTVIVTLIILVLNIEIGAVFMPLLDVFNDIQPKTSRDKAGCEKFHKKECIFISLNFDKNTHSLQDELVSDFDKPIYSEPSEVELCQAIEADLENEIESKSKEQDCAEKLSAKSCELDFIADSDADKVFCKKVTGYEQKLSGKKILAIDEAKKAAYDIAQQKIAEDNAIRERVKAELAFGQVLIEDYKIMIRGLTFTPQESLALLGRFQVLMGLAQSGSIPTAKIVVQGLEIDDKVFKQEDKDRFIAKIDKFLATQN